MASHGLPMANHIAEVSCGSKHIICLSSARLLVQCPSLSPVPLIMALHNDYDATVNPPPCPQHSVHFSIWVLGVWRWVQGLVVLSANQAQQAGGKTEWWTG